MNFENYPNIRIRKAYQIAKIAHENQVDEIYSGSKNFARGRR